MTVPTAPSLGHALPVESCWRRMARELGGFTPSWCRASAYLGLFASSSGRRCDRGRSPCVDLSEVSQSGKSIIAFRLITDNYRAADRARLFMDSLLGVFFSFQVCNRNNDYYIA